MANTFTPLGPAAGAPAGAGGSVLPKVSRLTAPSVPKPGSNGAGGADAITPLDPLPVHYG